MSEGNDNRGWRPRYRGGIFGPLVLIIIGLVFLLDNMNALSGDAWNILLSLWPVLLIIAGLDSLLKREGVAGPALLIGLGAIFLLANFGMLAWGVWALILRLWPVLIIAFGLDLMFGRRSLIGAALALVIVIAILAGALVLMGTGAPASTEEIYWLPEVKVEQVDVTLGPAAGALSVSALEDSPALASGAIPLQSGEGIDKRFTADNGVGVMSIRTQGFSAFYPSFGKPDAGWNVKLTPSFPLTLRVEMGVGDAALDLSNLKLKSLVAKMAVGKLHVTLPNTRFKGQIETAVGQLIIVVPQGAGVRIEADTAVTSVRMPEGYEEDEDDIYLSPNYDQAETRIELKVNQAVGSLVIEYGQ